MRTFLIASVSLLLSCSAGDEKFVAPAASSPSPPAESQGVAPMSYEQMLPELARISKQTGVANLSESSLADSQTELRVWRALGLVYPSCFILRVDSGKATASFASPKVVASKVVFSKGNPIYENTPLKEPHSGWSNLLTYLRQNGIDSSIKLTLEKRIEPYPDAEALILEMKTGSHHTMVHYIDSTVSEDGKKAFAICWKIQQEFDIQLACKS